jgi:hypothetical protein
MEDSPVPSRWVFAFCPCFVASKQWDRNFLELFNSKLEGF